MSRTAVVVALVLAVVLAAAALLLLREDAPRAGAGGSLLAFEPAQVTELSIQRPDGRIERLERDPADAGSWILRISGDGPGTGHEWPVMETQVRAMLRILSTMQADQPAPASAPGEEAITVLVGTGAGTSLALRLGMTPLSGRVVAQHPGEEQSYWVRADVAAALAERGVLAWRNPVLLRGLGPEVSRVELRGPGGRLVLSRGGGRWGLLEPVRAPAEEDAVNRLVGALASARATDFLDAGVPGETGLDAPSAVARVISTSRGPSGAATERVQELRVGRAADIAGTRVYVSVTEGSGGGSSGALVVTASAEPLAAITTDPTGFILRRGAVFPAGDVGSMEITLPGQPGRVLTRTISGWSAAGAGQAVPLPGETSRTIESLATLLTETPADQVLLTAPEALEEAFEVELRTLAGAPLDAVHVSVTGAGVAVRTGEVWRVYLAPGALEMVRGVAGATR